MNTQMLDADNYCQSSSIIIISLKSRVALLEFCIRAKVKIAGILNVSKQELNY